MVAVSVGRSEDTLKATFTRSLQARPTRPSHGLFHRLRRENRCPTKHDGRALERGQVSVIVSACDGAARVFGAHALSQHRVAAWRHSSSYC